MRWTGFAIMLGCIGINVPFVVFEIGLWPLNLFAIGLITGLLVAMIIEWYLES